MSYTLYYNSIRIITYISPDYFFVYLFIAICSAVIQILQLWYTTEATFWLQPVHGLYNFIYFSWNSRT